MMASTQLVRQGNGARHDLYLLEAATPEEVLPLPGGRFICLVAWDSRTASFDEISRLVRRLLDAGAVYVCAWGPGCERVHDICDEEQVGPLGDGEQTAMTTWHADEPLAEAVWFVLNVAVPEDRWIADCHATVGISIGSDEWARDIRVAFSGAAGSLARGIGEE